MGFIIFIIAVVAAYFSWKYLSKHFIKKGSHKIISHTAGVVVGFAVFVFVLIMGLAPDSKPTKKVTINGTAHPYKVAKEETYGFAGRDRERWIINSPQAITNEDRALTSIQAAKDLQDRTDADQVEIFLVIDGLDGAHGMPLAIAVYTPDGKGNSGEDNSPVWEVEASDQNLTAIQKRISVAWYEHKSKYLKDSGIVDEPRFVEFLSSTLNIPKEQATLPWINRSKFNYIN